VARGNLKEIFADVQGLKPTAMTTWAARDVLMPRCAVQRTVALGWALSIGSNGSAGCYGGWDVVIPGIRGGKWYELCLRCRGRRVPSLHDSAPALARWLKDHELLDWDNILITEQDADTATYAGRFRAPDGAETLCLRLGIRWTEVGTVQWKILKITEVPEPERRIIRAAAAAANPGGNRTVEDNVKFFCDLLGEVAEEKPDMVCLPECITSIGVKDGHIACARPIPGPETEALAAVAKKHRFMLGFTMMEREGDLVYNAGVIIGKDGRLVGKYRKVHLAILEGWSGVTPGKEFPVFDTECGKIGMNICKDNSVLESCRVPARAGMELLLMPIMGDHRAAAWRRGRPVFDEEKWKIIMRVRAIDNHIHMLIARNNRVGSCIIAPNGDFLAYNDGSTNFVTAEINLNVSWRVYRGGDYKSGVWADRRPHLYKSLCR